MMIPGLIKPQPRTLLPCFRANKNGTDQTGILSATLTKLTFTTEVFDIGGFYDAANSKWIPPAGRFWIGCTVDMTAGAVDQAFSFIQLYKNGSGHLVGAVQASSGTGDCGLTGAWVVDSDGNDEFEIYIRGGGAGDKTVTGNVAYSYFQGHAL